MTNTELDALLVELDDVLQHHHVTPLYTDDIRQAIAAIRALRVERERLREALRPFAGQTIASGPTEAAMIVRARSALGDA